MAADGLTAVVVAHEPDERLDDCLASLAFADERMVVELGQVPGLEELARRHDARLLPHESVPVVERVRGPAAEAAAYDWILFVDPDEVVTPGLAERLRSLVEDAPGDVAAARVPWRFHFAGEELRTTAWGRPDQSKRVLVHRDRVELVRHVHRGIELNPGSREVRVGERPDAVLEHDWCSSYRDFLRKHRRYLGQEGESRWERGERFSWLRMVGTTGFVLARELFHHRGVLGGFRGVALSALRAWYEARAWWALREHERSLGRGASRGGKEEEDR